MYKTMDQVNFTKVFFQLEYQSGPSKVKPSKTFIEKRTKPILVNILCVNIYDNICFKNKTFLKQQAVIIFSWEFQNY